MASKLPVRQALRLVKAPQLSISARTFTTRVSTASSFIRPLSQARTFSVSTWRKAGLMPDTSDPKPVESEESHEIQDPTPLPDEEYHMRADGFLEQVVNKMEELQEGREDIDVEFAVCSSLT